MVAIKKVIKAKCSCFYPGVKVVCKQRKAFVLCSFTYQRFFFVWLGVAILNNCFHFNAHLCCPIVGISLSHIESSQRSEKLQKKYKTPCSWLKSWGKFAFYTVQLPFIMFLICILTAISFVMLTLLSHNVLGLVMMIGFWFY